MQNRWTYIFLAPAVAGFGFRTVPAAAQAPDVNGVRLGMTLDEAKSKIGTGYEVRIDKFADPAILLLSAATPHSAATGDGWVIQAINGKVAYIEHQRYFPAGSQPERSTAKQGLEQKYGGPPTDEHNGFPEWFYDNGRPVPPASAGQLLQKCNGAGVVAPSPLVVTTDHGASGSPMDYMTNFRPGCPVHVLARLQGTQLVSGIDVKLFDEPAMYAEALSVMRAKEAAKQQDIDKGKQVKTSF